MSHVDYLYANEDFYDDAPLFVVGERVVLVCNGLEFTVAHVYPGRDREWAKYHLRRDDGTLLKWVKEIEIDLPY